MKNIDNGYPICATFDVSNSYINHAVVIHGYNIMSGVIYVMDPSSNFITVSYDASVHTYKYVDASSASTLVFDSATCRYWSA